MSDISINSKMIQLGQVRSVIRETFEYGNQRAKEIGRENVFDFSLGNPSVPAPDAVQESMISLLTHENPVALHGYTSAPGDAKTRQAIADDLNSRFHANVSKDDLYMTCGAAASLTVTLTALIVPENQEEVIVFAPFFPEYRVFAEQAGASLIAVPADESTFEINFGALEERITTHTKAVIINTPNNPTGVILKENSILQLCALLKKKSEEYQHAIYLISDEPYRELVYDKEFEVLPYLTNYYSNAIVCYSFSKSLSLPGERIGYILVNPRMENNKLVYAAVCGAGRALGFVCAPSMMQKIIPDVLGKTSDLEVYKTNRDLLYNELSAYGFTCIHPDGAFYLFVKSPEENAGDFCMHARKYELLLVPSDSFGCKGYVRIAYCVTTEMIQKSLPAFKKLAEDYCLRK